jgi:hypothetical protein
MSCEAFETIKLQEQKKTGNTESAKAGAQIDVLTRPRRERGRRAR